MINKSTIKSDSSFFILSSYFLIKLFGTLFAIFVFNKFTPLIDSFNYIQNFYNNDFQIRTLIVQRITTFLILITNSKFLPHLFFSLLSGLGILIYSLKSKKITPLFLLLLPSSLVWTSIVGKEAIFVGFASITLAIWPKMINQEMKKADWLSLGTCFLICLLMRPHYTVPICWLMIVASMINLNLKNSIIISSYVLLLALAAYLINHDLMFRGYGGIDPSGRASRFLLLNIDLLNPMDQFKKFYIMGFLFGIIGPLPIELPNRPEFIPFFIEGLAIALTPILLLIFSKSTFLKRINYKYLKNYIFGLLPAVFLLMLIHMPFGILNPGSAIRWRVNFELVFYFAPLLLYWESKKNA